MKPDIIVSWPRNCDYPLWREFIRKHRAMFNEIIIAFTETHQGDDYRGFVENAMFEDYCHFIQPQEIHAGEDWRSVAINSALLHSYNAQWIWFTEEDFYPLVSFWSEAMRMEKNGKRAIGVTQGERLHPCSLLLRRDLLNSLDKNFGIVPDKLDHFGLIQKQLEQQKEDIGIIEDTHWMHYNGLSHNWTLASRDEQPNYKLEVFLAYLKSCLEVSVPLDNRFTFIAQRILSKG